MTQTADAVVQGNAEAEARGEERPRRKPWRRLRRGGLVVFAALVALAWWSRATPSRGTSVVAPVASPSVSDGAAGPPAKRGDGGGRRGGGSDRPIPVQVATVKVADVGVTQIGIGTVVPRQTVTVRSRVSGQLTRVLFKEGQQVAAGQLLAQVDGRPFEAQLAQAEGQLARDRALLKNAELDRERFKSLSRDVIARQQVDAQEALVRQYEGTVRIDEGLVEAARLQVAFTRVTAPFAGQIGLRLIDAGNYVGAADAAGIAVINAVQPICVVFSLPEDRVPRLRDRLRAGEPLVVEAWDRDDKARLATGTLLTLDNQIDPTTGTIKLKAEFANRDGALFPNQFVNARLLLDTLYGVAVVPATAIQHGSAGAFVYTVGADNAIGVKPVTPGPPKGDHVAIGRSLRPGDVVVTNGADKLREGVKVQPLQPGNGEGGGPRTKQRLADRRGGANQAP